MVIINDEKATDLILAIFNNLERDNEHKYHIVQTLTTTNEAGWQFFFDGDEPLMGCRTLIITKYAEVFVVPCLFPYIDFYKQRSKENANNGRFFSTILRFKKKAIPVRGQLFTFSEIQNSLSRSKDELNFYLYLNNENASLWKERKKTNMVLEDIGEILYETSKHIDNIDKYYKNSWDHFFSSNNGSRG